MGLALLVVLVVVFGSSSTERGGEASEQTEPSGPDQLTQPGFKPVPAPTFTPPAASTPPAPPGSMPQATAAGQAATPPPAPDGQSPAEPAVDAVLAGMTEIALGPGLQSLNMSLVRFYPAVGPEAFAAAARLGLHVKDSAPTVLAVDMQADETSASPHVVLLLEVKYTTPDGKHITLWKGSKQIVSVDLSTLNTTNDKPYKQIAAKNTAELFKQLVDAVLRARAKAKAK